MSRANQRPSLRAAVLLLVLVAQLLIPLLHGHFGTPNQAGLHVHTAPSRIADSHFHVLAAHDGSEAVGEHHAMPSDSEPFEVDVQGALQPLDFVPLPLLVIAGLALLTLGLRAARMRCAEQRSVSPPEPLRVCLRWRGRVIRPSPAQAPPFCS